MKKVATVGHIDHGKTTLTAAIESALEKQQVLVYENQREKVLEYNNPYAFLNEKPLLSKSRLKKCEKGLHEYSETNNIEETELGTRKLWACIHCGKIMNQ